MSNPELQLSTLFVLNEAGRILRTREPNGSKGPLFALVRGSASAAFACGIDVPDDIAARLAALVAREPHRDDGRPPTYAEDYRSLCELVPEVRLPLVTSTAIALAAPGQLTPIAKRQDHPLAADLDLKRLRRYFRHWTEIDLIERSPVVGVLVGADVVSICYCARVSDTAGEAGVDTASEFQGRGLATQVVSEWARMMNERGKSPLYSALAQNRASLRIADKLGFVRYATDWSVVEPTKSNAPLEEG